MTASYVLSLFLLHDGDGNWTGMVRGQRSKGAGSCCRHVGGSPPPPAPSGEVAAGCGVDVAVRGALQVPIRPEEADGGQRDTRHRAGELLLRPQDKAMFQKATSGDFGLNLIKQEPLLPPHYGPEAL